MISFKKILSYSSSQIIIGPKDFWIEYFEKNLGPNLELIDFSTISSFKEKLEPNFFQLLNSEPKTYIIKNGEDISSKNWQEIGPITQDQKIIFLLENSSTKQNNFPKSIAQNIIPYKENKVLYIKEYTNAINRNLSPNQVQVLMDSCDHFYESKNFINLMDLFYGNNPMNDEMENTLSEHTSTNNEFKICELLLQGNKKESLKLIQESRNLNFFSIHALLNKLAYNSFMAINYPNLIPDWLAKKATRSPLATRILKTSMEFEWNLKNSPINEIDGFIAFIQKL